MPRYGVVSSRVAAHTALFLSFPFFLPLLLPSLLSFACSRAPVRERRYAPAQVRSHDDGHAHRCYGVSQRERETKHARAKTRTTEETFRSVRGARTYIPVRTYVCTYLSPTMHVGNTNRRIHVRYGPVRVYIRTAKAR